MINVGDKVKRHHNGKIYTVLGIAKNLHGIHDGWLQIDAMRWISPLLVDELEDEPGDLQPKGDNK